MAEARRAESQLMYINSDRDQSHLSDYASQSGYTMSASPVVESHLPRQGPQLFLSKKFGNDFAQSALEHKMMQQIEELEARCDAQERKIDSIQMKQGKKIEEIAVRVDELMDQVDSLQQKSYAPVDNVFSSILPGSLPSSFRGAQMGKLAGRTGSGRTGSGPNTMEPLADDLDEKEKLEEVQLDMDDTESDDSLQGHHKKVVYMDNLETAFRQAEKEFKLKKTYLFENQWQWKACENNAFGAFIYLAMTKGLPVAFKQIGVMLILSWMIQFVITSSLLDEIGALEDNPGHCGTPSMLQLAVVGFWILMMLNYFPQWFRAAVVCIFAEEMKVKGHGTVACVRALPARILIMIVSVGLEMLMWIFVSYTGILFILSANSPIEVLAAVVGMFLVQEIPEFVFGASAQDIMKIQVSQTRFKVQYSSVCCGLEARTVFEAEWIYTLHLHCWVVVGLSVLTVGLTRMLPEIQCDDSLKDAWNPLMPGKVL